ncbi:MAG: heme ABC transporter permease [Gammaproteobacteria bacterium]|nr:heme ABC transporter permease [Gammaproteobacteria bacterium]
MWIWFHKLGSPKYFYDLSGRWLPWLGCATAVCMLVGLYWGLVVAPTDYQQGESYRIIFIHVPAAWMSLFVYMIMATSAAIGMIWKLKLSDIIAANCAPLGASFTFLALVTGMLWGKPMWGAYWVWDARLTSELILLFLYLGVIALRGAIEDPRTAARASGILSLVGVVNIPIIHYSVTWWNTLHQGPTISRFAAPAMDASMLWPLLIMVAAFMLYFAVVLLLRARSDVLVRERQSAWVRALAQT